MSSSTDSHGAHGAQGAHGAHDAHGPSHYYKVYATLLVLFAISVAGPMLEIRVLTLITAFGIAVVKAYLVAANFMHLNIEKRYIVQLMAVCLALMGVFYFGVSPDVMKHWGANWENYGANNLKAVIHASEEHAKEHDAASTHAAPAAGEKAPAEGAAAPAAH